jgi:hypothetical protein
VKLCVLVLVHCILSVVDVDDELEEYRQVLLEMHECRIEIGGEAKNWNKLVDRMQVIHLVLRETEAGRAGITRLALDENPTVAGWSATNAMAWAPEVARPVLEELAQRPGLGSISAEYALKEYDKGKLNTSWDPISRRKDGRQTNLCDQA